MTLNEAKGFARWMFALAVFAFFASIVVSALPFGRDSTDPSWPLRSGMKPLTDSMTGCQYLQTSSGLHPRLDRNGKQICEEKK